MTTDQEDNNPSAEIIEAEVICKDFSMEEGHLLMRYAIFFNETHKAAVLMGISGFPLTDDKILSDMYILCNKIDALKMSRCIVLTEGSIATKLAAVDSALYKMELHTNDKYSSFLHEIKVYFRSDAHVPKMVRVGKLAPAYEIMYNEETLV